MHAGHQRSHFDVRRIASTNFQLLRALQHPRHQFVGAGADGDGDRNRHAALAGGTVGGADQRIGGAVEVGVGHHHHVVLRPAQVVDAAADAMRMLALEQLRDAAGELDDFEAALHLAQRIGQGLAVLGGKQLGDVSRVLVDQVAELEQDAGAALRRGGAPVGKGGAGGGHGAVDVGPAGQRDLACDAARGRIEHLADAGAGAGIGVAIDPVADQVGGIDELEVHGGLSLGIGGLELVIRTRCRDEIQ